MGRTSPLLIALLGSVGCTAVVGGVLDDKPAEDTEVADGGRDGGDSTGDDGGDLEPDGATPEVDAGNPGGGEPDAGGNTGTSPNDGFTISMGAEHGCVLAPSGKATCWGESADGQLSLDGNGNYRTLAAGGYHTCAINDQGALVCVGRNNRGQRASAAGPFTKVAAGDFHTCVLDGAGKVTCFGDDTEGQANPPGDERFEDIAAGPALSCGIAQTSHALRCWGRGASGIESRASGLAISAISASPLGVCVVDRSTQKPVCWGEFSIEPPTRLRDVRAVSVGAVACALDGTGSVTCWGVEPTLVLDQGPYVAVGVSTEAACAVPARGPIQCAGWPDISYSPPPDYP
jgi:Regulator of chromosome condensation (RCC1) repeat